MKSNLAGLNEMNETAFPHTFKEMKEIHFIGKLG